MIIEDFKVTIVLTSRAATGSFLLFSIQLLYSPSQGVICGE
jgi:hypothetical protein